MIWKLLALLRGPIGHVGNAFLYDYHFSLDQHDILFQHRVLGLNLSHVSANSIEFALEVLDHLGKRLQPGFIVPSVSYGQID